MMCVDLELPKVRAWARSAFPAYSDAEIDRVIQEWSRAPQTRGELIWLELTLARSIASDR
jgi:hypothetical protein